MKDKKYLKVRAHSHYKQEYKGAPHNMCNLKYSVPKKIPKVFHKRVSRRIKKKTFKKLLF